MLGYFIALGLGLAGGAVCTFILLEQKFRNLHRLTRQAEETAARNERRERDLNARDARLNSEEARFHAEHAAFQSKVVTYDELLRNENTVLKRDLRNVDLTIRKHKLDLKLQDQTSAKVDNRATELAKRWLKDNLKWIDSRLGPSNYAVCKQRLLDVIDWCREVGYDVSAQEEADLLSKLQTSYEREVRLQIEREEQARIKAQIREEARLEREQKREIEQAEAEKRRIREALDCALREARDQHQVLVGQQSAEIELLRASLAEAEARAQRAISMAQLTRAGHVYVISNIGSFGEGVYKVGMTRRLEPLDRVKELGDASVPFPFDVHMMISCDDAPTLENALHRELHRRRVNPLNPRKEFFRVDFQTIREIVEKNHGVVEYIADAEALEYRQSLTMSPEDQEFIEHVYELVAEEEGEEVLEEDPVE